MGLPPSLARQIQESGLLCVFSYLTLNPSHSVDVGLQPSIPREQKDEHS